MMDLVNGFMADMKAGPAWVFYWVNFMGLVFMLSIPFALRRKEARWILVATLIAAPIIMMALYSKFGYERILGLGHILAWSIAIIPLWRSRKNWRVGETIIGKWVALTFVVMLISLVFDVSDVARYAMGARG